MNKSKEIIESIQSVTNVESSVIILIQIGVLGSSFIRTFYTTAVWWEAPIREREAECRE